MILGEAFSAFYRISFPKNFVAYLEEPPHRKNTCRLLEEWLAQMRHLLVIQGRGVVKSFIFLILSITFGVPSNLLL